MNLKSVLLPSLLFAGLSSVSVVFANDMFVSSEMEPVPLGSVENYWTEERMKNAKPYPNMIEDEEPNLLAADNIASLADGEPGTFPGSAPKVSKALLRKILRSTASDTEAFDIQEEPSPLGYTYPFPFTRFYVLTSLYSTYPYKTIGKVFFTEAGANYVCSGSSIGGRAVLTAGHCVCNGNKVWHTNWTFVPAYRDNSRPYGTWAAESLTTFADYLNYKKPCRDVGFAVTKYNSSGQKLSSVVGSLGFAWNFNVAQVHWNSFGYPAESPFNGRKLVECQASHAVSDSPGGCTPATIGIGCDMTGGSSGGPWIKNFNSSVSGMYNYANGLNSYGYSTQPGAMYSPYFDTEVKKLRDLVVVK
ncbi:MAG: trypsin-like serine protease [Candidatus Brocadia sp.]|nr:trypsin-like serine protease [Candidatus Brocadia sp.]